MNEKIYYCLRRALRKSGRACWVRRADACEGLQQYLAMTGERAGCGRHREIPP